MMRSIAFKHVSRILLPSSGIAVPYCSIQGRFYRGDSGEGSARTLSKAEILLQEKSQRKYDSIFERHIRLPTIDIDSPSPEGYENLTQKEAELAMRRKRLIYRAKQRGWLEVDLLLGTWASKNVATLSTAELDEFENFVNMETIDIYNILTLRAGVPEEMKMMQRIQDWVKSSPLGKADPAKYESVKMEHKLT